MNRFSLSIVFIFLALTNIPVEADELDCPETDKGAAKYVRIGVLYRDPSITGRSQLDGFEAALRDYKTSQAHRICRVKLPYRSENHGYQILKDIIKDNDEKKKPAIHMVFGPTDSGVLQNAAKNYEKFREARLPVISPIVATEVEFSANSWLFTTNPDIGVRTSKIRTFLDRHGVDSIGILYQDNEYGLQAERLFRGGVSASLGDSDADKHYRSIRFNSTDDLTQGIDQLIADRPGAIGIFASRQRVKDFIGALDYQNHGFNPYSPLLFTTIDVRAFQVDDLHFVAMKTKSDQMNEVYALAYDTAWFVIDLVHSLDPISHDPENWATQFQDGFVGLMSGSAGRGPLTGMFFDRGKNLASPSIYAFESGKLINMSDVRLTIWGPFAETWRYLENLVRRYGYLPGLNIVVVVLLVYWLTRRDLSQWNEEKTPGRKTKQALRRVVLFNILVALLLYLFLVISNTISWGALTAAFAVGLGYPALLKSTFGKTQYGRTIGVSEYYEDYLRQLHDDLMEAKYHEKKATVDVIAMTNTLPKMRETLLNIYSYNSPKRFEELVSQLDKDLGEAQGSLKKRLVYANRLRLHLDWNELKRLKLVPHIASEDELIGPDDILDVSVEYLWGSETKTSTDLETDFNKYLDELRKISSERADELQAEIQGWLEQSLSERGRLRCYLRALFMRDQFEIGKIIQRQYLPTDANEHASDREWWRQYKWVPAIGP